MFHLHDVVYQIVSNSTLVAEVVENQHLLQSLSHHESQALLAVLQDNSAVKALLSNDLLQNAVQAAAEEPWVPPEGP
jgi:hypothetical protein